MENLIKQKQKLKSPLVAVAGKEKIMRIKVKLKDDIATVKLLIKHPMESGRRKDELGNLIDANYVTQITGHVAGVQVFEVNTGISVAKKNIPTRCGSDGAAKKLRRIFIAKKNKMGVFWVLSMWPHRPFRREELTDWINQYNYIKIYA